MGSRNAHFYTADKSLPVFYPDAIDARVSIQETGRTKIQSRESLEIDPCPQIKGHMGNRLR
jgi:hypothetical protein